MWDTVNHSICAKMNERSEKHSIFEIQQIHISKTGVWRSQSKLVIESSVKERYVKSRFPNSEVCSRSGQTSPHPIFPVICIQSSTRFDRTVNL